MRIALAYRSQRLVDHGVRRREIGIADAQHDHVFALHAGLLGEVMQVPGVRGIALDPVGKRGKSHAQLQPGFNASSSGTIQGLCATICARLISSSS